jgi:cystathionine beta-lyase
MHCCHISPAVAISSTTGSSARRRARGSMRLDATYLAWVDFSGTGLPAKDVAARVKDRARIFASPGEQFGPGGETWLRFNFATPRPILEEALDRLDDAFRELRT